MAISPPRRHVSVAPLARACACAAALAVAIAVPAPAALDEAGQEVYRRLDRAKAEAGAIPEQARALARLAWLDPDVDAPTRAAAREQLIGYGKHALLPIREVIRDGAMPLRADATMALIQTFYRLTAGSPPDYLPGLEEALWYGSVEARRMALYELSRHRYPPAMLPTIDTAYEFPVLRSLCIRSIARYGDDSARHFLREALESDSAYERRLAAAALASIGAKAFETLKDAALDGEGTVRDSAVAALLPYTTVDDLSVLYGYVEAARAGEEAAARAAASDPGVLAQVRDRIEQLEERVREELLDDMQDDDEAPADRTGAVTG